MPPSSPSPHSVADELRQLFTRGEYESLLIRTDHLQKRKRVDSQSTQQVIDLVRALSLIQLGRSAEAALLLHGLPSTLSKPTLKAVNFAKLYVAWATNDGVDVAISQAASLQGNDARRLEAQLLYRSGRYTEASDMFLEHFRVAKATLDDKQKPATTSRWRLMSREPVAAPVTAAELEQYAAAVNELGTNAMASLVLAGNPDDAIGLKTHLRNSYELEYNAACAQIAQSKFTEADITLQQAEALLRAELDDDDDDGDEAMAPVVVQKAYLRHLAGNLTDAKRCYVDIIAEGRADAASLAVAANNHVVALGQQAFGKARPPIDGARALLPKEQHNALVDGLKKMRATGGRDVERKLTTSQRRAMARNRAILLVQMGRMDACRTEVARFKSEFPGDKVVPLIEASLIAWQSGLETADKVLSLAGDELSVRAARVQLAVSHGDKRRAAKLLQELFGGRAAAVVTAASLLEEVGEVDEGLSLLKGLVQSCGEGQKNAARKMVAETLLRAKKYEDAATVLKVVVDTDASDSTAVAQLVVATSFFDAEEAERVAVRIAPMVDGKEVDVIALEALPPPKRKQVAAMKNSESAKNLEKEELDAATRAAVARERKKRKRKVRLPKDYDPNGPAPDPERWLPKTLRSGYKKKNKNKIEQNFKGSQGADAVTTEAAAVKNAERSAAKAAAAATDSPLGPGGRPRQPRKRKNRR